MDTQDHHIKNDSSGHENNHVCHRCGWSFPNPHPSAKHRRAHKKLCGTIEGYSLIESHSEHSHLAVSDNDQPSDDDDDDFHTPSSQIDKRNVKDIGSGSGSGGGGRVGEKSNRSEGEMFADAVMEFSDSGVSPVIEEHIRELNTDVESQLLKVGAIAVSSGPSSDPLEMAAKSLNDTGVETSSVGSSGIISLRFDDFPVKFETPVDATVMATDAETSKEANMESVVPEADRERESELEANMGKSLDFVSLENVVYDSMTTDDKKQMGDEQISENLSTDKVIEQKKDEDDELEENVAKNYVTLSVKDDDDELDNVDYVIEDFKDYNILKSSFPLDLGSTEVIRLVQGDKDATINDPDEKGVEKPTDDEKVNISGLVVKSGEDHRSRDISQRLYSHSIDSEPPLKAHAEIAVIEGDGSDNSEKCITATEESSKEPPEAELSANKKTIQEHADNYVISENNKTNGSLEEDGNEHNERAKIELLDTARDEVTRCGSEPSRDEVNNKLENQHDGFSAKAISVASSSRADSLEGNWGSVSGLSFADSQPPEKSDAYMQMPKRATDEYHRNKLDVCDPPSFMTLVQSGNVTTSDIRTAHDKQQTKHEDLQAGWFPSLSNVVNESQGRKKNEEIIAKVSNWSTGKQRAPLKTLLGEVAKSPNSKQVSIATQSDDAAKAIPRSEAANNQAATKEVKKESNSPGRYPAEIKKEKRKGRPYWVPFVCCSSVH